MNRDRYYVKIILVRRRTCAVRPPKCELMTSSTIAQQGIAVVIYVTLQVAYSLAVSFTVFVVLTHHSCR